MVFRVCRLAALFCAVVALAGCGDGVRSAAPTAPTRLPDQPTKENVLAWINTYRLHPAPERLRSAQLGQGLEVADYGLKRSNLPCRLGGFEPL